MTLGYRCKYCQKAMVYMKKRPKAGDIVRKSHFWSVEGQIKDGDITKCQYCHKREHGFCFEIKTIEEFVKA